jgi:hypothetical protein
MVFAKNPRQGIAFLPSFVWLCNTHLILKKYVMEPKEFWYARGIACPLSNFNHKQYPSNSLNQNNSIHGVYKIPSWRYYFPFKFEIVIFWGKERFFGLNARLEPMFW